MKINDYERQLTEPEIQQEGHRNFVGGLWDIIGDLQFQFLLKHGLTKDMNLIDIGCGCLRGGIKFIEYLEIGKYYGVDANASLLDAGYYYELPKYNLQNRLPRENLLKDENFSFSKFNVMFDMGLAISVFTHLPLNHIKFCLIELAKVFKPGAKFFTTFFENPDTHPIENDLKHLPGGVVTHLAADPYHYSVNDIRFVADVSVWDFQYIGDWSHPRSQKMLCLVRK